MLFRSTLFNIFIIIIIYIILYNNIQFLKNLRKKNLFIHFFVSYYLKILSHLLFNF